MVAGSIGDQLFRDAEAVWRALAPAARLACRQVVRAYRNYTGEGDGDGDGEQALNTEQAASRLLAVLAAVVASPAPGQFTAPETGSAAPTLGDARTQKFRVGLVVTAEGGTCRDIYATLPVPADWPEQKVQILQ